MEALERLSSHLETRLVDLKDARAQGVKIVGYPPGGFLPEELVLAAGAIPLCLARGGDHAPVELAGRYICRWIDTFWRAQIGYGTSDDDPLYSLLDLLAVPITDNHVRAMSDVLSYHTDINVYPFGVPHMKEESAFDYYLDGIHSLRTWLEELTGSEITDSALRQAISQCNRERELFSRISLLRQRKALPINSRDYVALHHGSLIADKEFMISLLESALADLERQSPEPANGPRLLLTGSTMAAGDYTILDLIEEAGGVVVIEEFAEGLRPYWATVPEEGDPVRALAEAYFSRRVPPAWFRPATEMRRSLLKLARDFSVSGVVWYALMYRESYEVESHIVREMLRQEAGLPMLSLHSDYAPADTGQMRTRLESFIQSITG